jgi:tetratricopeptide (TPR) repeat protein
VTARGFVALALVAAAGVAAFPRAARADSEDRATLAQLEQRSRAFYDLLERGERERAAAVWPALSGDLARFQDGLEERLGRMRDEVIERDGDLDELYRSPRWRDPEIMSLVAAYHLAWVRYQGAQLVGEPAKKRALLQKAIEGFSRFLLVNEVPEIYADSLYGRGLAFLDLGENAKAIEDLGAAAEEPRVAAKARAALEEARRRGSGRQAPAESDPEAQLARLGDLVERAGGGDPAAEKDATQLARGIAVRGGAWPARVSSLVAAKLGDGTPAGVRSSYGLLLLAQLAVDRGRCGDVAPLAEASAGLHDAGRARHRPEILFLDAGCRLNSGQARDAADRFALLLREFPDGPRAREATYYRFRALDVARTADPSLTGAYEEALTTFLGRYPAGDGAGEARYLLAELHRSSGDCKRAEAEYGAVGSGPFAARARLGGLECRVASAVKAGPAGREELIAALRAFVREVPDRQLAARAALLGAVVAASATPPDHAAVIELLDGFEKRYPDAKEMQARAIELRLGARVATGQLDGAERDLDAFLAARGDEQERRRALPRLGRDLATRAERGSEAERRTALALARKVYAALVQATGDPRDRIMLADLELKAGDAAAARREYEEVLAKDGGSAEAIRGAARAAAALGDRDRALAYWRAILDASPPGGTAWYEARLAQVTLLAGAGRKEQACELLRAARGRATSVGGDQMEAQLRAMEPDVCR